MKLDCHTAQVLISGWLDQELTQQQQQQLHRHLAECDQCQQHLNELESLKLGVKQAAMLTSDSRTNQALASDQVANWLFRLGWVLLLVALLPLGGWMFVKIWQDSSVPLAMRMAFTGITLGLLMLLIGVIRQRWLAAKTDKYKKVQL